MRSTLTALCLLVFVLTPGLTSGAQALAQTPLTFANTDEVPANSGIGVQLLDIPAAARNDPRAQTYIVDRLAPGVEIQRRIQVQNNTDSTQTVRIYPGAATISDGSFIGGNDPAVNELTNWTVIDRPQLELPTNTDTDVTVTITVPPDAAESEQYAVVWAEVRSLPTDGTNIIQASRTGIRIYLSVGPGNGAPADFDITSLTAGKDAQANPTVTTLVTNTGGRALDMTGELTLAGGPSGLSAGPFPLQQAITIAPGMSRNLMFTLDAGLPAGPWQATLTLESGLIEQTATATITFPDTGQSDAVTPEEQSHTLWVGLGVGGIVLAGALLWWLRRRRLSGQEAHDDRSGDGN